MGVLAKIASRPAVRDAAGVLVNIAVERIRERRKGGSVTPSTGEQTTMVNEAAEAIARRPELVNAMNAEPWYQSRVKVGLIITAIGWLLNRFGVDLGFSDADNEMITSVVMAFGGGLAGIGRWISGLKPMTWNPLTWIGLGR
jgi:hypothetical protein